MRGDDREPVAAGLGEHVPDRSRQSQEVLRLVQVERGVAAEPSGRGGRGR